MIIGQSHGPDFTAMTNDGLNTMLGSQIPYFDESVLARRQQMGGLNGVAVAIQEQGRRNLILVAMQP
jgi:hypothetical protein